MSADVTTDPLHVDLQRAALRYAEARLSCAPAPERHSAWKALKKASRALDKRYRAALLRRRVRKANIEVSMAAE